MRSSVPCRTSPRGGAMLSPLDKQQEHRLLPVDCQQDNHRQPCLERAKFAKTAEGRTASQFSSARRTLVHGQLHLLWRTRVRRALENCEAVLPSAVFANLARSK